MNNKVCCFVFSYFRREWHATSDIVLSHVVTLLRTLSSWPEAWPVSMCDHDMSPSYHSGLFSPRPASVCWSSLIRWIIFSPLLLLNVPENRVFQFLCFSRPSDGAGLTVLDLCPSHIQGFTWNQSWAVSTSSVAAGVWADQCYEERNLQPGQYCLACLCLSCVLRPGQCQWDCQPVQCMVRSDAI